MIAVYIFVFDCFLRTRRTAREDPRLAREDPRLAREDPRLAREDPRLAREVYHQIDERLEASQCKIYYDSSSRHVQ